MKNRTIVIIVVSVMLVLIIGFGIFFFNNMMGGMHMFGGQNDNVFLGSGTSTHDYAKGLIKPKEGQPIKKFTLVAKESSLNIRDGLTLPVWTYNGTVPGKEIRVTQGDFVQVELKNEMKNPVTIHWHGYPVISAMDGVPGLNQDAVRPGETFLYEFSADIPGTYWYHSHQDSANQLDKGLYGALIVEPKEALKINKDYTLILDEWMENPMGDAHSKQGMGGMMNMGSMHDSDSMAVMEDGMMSAMYNIYTVNGKSGKLISPLEVKKGDIVRLRFINAGYRSHGIHLPGQDIKIVATDGQDIEGAKSIRDQIVLISPGERYDVEFTVLSDEGFYIDLHDANKYNDQVKIPIKVLDGNGIIGTEPYGINLPVFDFTGYGKPGKDKYTLEQKFDIDYRVELNTRAGKKGLEYTINGKVFKELPPLKVKTGDMVKFTFENKSKVDHPMHLHGHFFQVLSKNDKPLSGAAIIKDTLLVRPGEKYIVAFKADNPGLWVYHCHELHHAAAGMMQEVVYTDFKSNYTPDPKNKFNMPE